MSNRTYERKTKNYDTLLLRTKKSDSETEMKSQIRPLEQIYEKQSFKTVVTHL